jgi:ribosomal protein S18 acetylase RimI-like enzyme
MQIRRFAPADAADVSALWARVFGYAEARNAPEKVLADKLRWDGRLLVAEENGSIMGTLMVGYDGHRGWLYRLAVDEGARRRGIGRQLVREAEQLLIALGCAKVNLQLHEHNDIGARFWQSVGYGREVRIDMGKDLTGETACGKDAGC